MNTLHYISNVQCLPTRIKAHLDTDCWEYEFNEGEQPDKRQLKLQHARGDEGTEAHRKNDSDKSLNGYKHDGVDAEVLRQEADDHEETAVGS